MRATRWRHVKLLVRSNQYAQFSPSWWGEWERDSYRGIYRWLCVVGREQRELDNSDQRLLRKRHLKAVFQIVG